MSGVAKKRRGLGRGLGALISSEPVKVDPAASQQSSTNKTDKVVSLPVSEAPKAGELESDALVRFISISSVSPNPEQPRKTFNPTEVSELAQSIRTLGVLQPIVVRPTGDSGTGNGDTGQFQIVAGERRWRAAQEADLKQLPVIIRNFNDQQALEVGLIENVQRTDLSPLEEARGYDELMKRFGLTQSDVAEKVGKNRTSISNAVRLLKLPIEVQAFVESKALSVGHAKAILTVNEPKLRVALAHKVVKEQLSVRELERIVSRKVNLLGGASGQRKGKTGRDGSGDRGSAHSDLAAELQKVLGTKVRIAEHASGRGKVIIEYFSVDELERVFEAICLKDVV